MAKTDTRSNDASNGATPRAEGDNKKKSKPSPTTKTSPNKFKGGTSDLNGKVITEGSSTPTAEQFKELQKQLKVYASANYSADVGRSIATMTTKTTKDFKPTKPDPSLWTTYEENADGTPKLDADGDPIEIIDQSDKEVLEDMYKQQVKDSSRSYVRYTQNLRSMFEIIVGQIDDNVLPKLEAMDGYKEAEDTDDSIRLLTLLRDLCYKDTKTKVHRITAILRAKRKLLVSRQRDEDSSGFIKAVKQRHEVLKAMNGSMLDDEIISASLENYDKTITLKAYKSMSLAKQREVQKRAEQELLASIIIEGSNADTSNLRLTLAQQFSLGCNLYPTNPTHAADMVNEFAGTNKVKRQNKPPTNKRNNGGQQRQGTVNVTHGISDASPVPHPYQQEGRQLLMAAMETAEDFNNDGICFFQVGTVTVESAGSVSDSNTIDDEESDWNYWANIEDESNSNVTDVIPTTNGATWNAIQSLATLQSSASVHTVQSTPSTVATTTSTFDRSVGISTHPTNDIETMSSNTEVEPTTDKSTVPAIITSVNSSYKPDPPGAKFDVISSKNPRSAPAPKETKNLTLPPWIYTPKRRGSRSLQRRANGITALDLATTQWQRESMLGCTQTYRYPRRIEHMFAQVCRIEKNWILLDSESSVHLIVNKDLLSNIRLAPNGESMNVHCNAGSAKTRYIGEFRGF